MAAARLGLPTGSLSKRPVSKLLVGTGHNGTSVEILIILASVFCYKAVCFGASHEAFC